VEKLEHKLEALGSGAFALRLMGAVDVFSYKDLKQIIEDFVKTQAPPRLYIDMRDVQYVGSSGWSVFFLQSAALEKAGGALCLGGMSERVQRALTMIAPRKGLLLTVSNEAEALALLQAPPPLI
jgi:anti-anti-sigma factor